VRHAENLIHQIIARTGVMIATRERRRKIAWR